MGLLESPPPMSPGLHAQLGNLNQWGTPPGHLTRDGAPCKVGTRPHLADRYCHYLPARGEYHCGPVTEEDTQVLGGASLAHGLLLEVGGPQPSAICSPHGQSVLYKVSTFWGAPLHWIPSPPGTPCSTPPTRGPPPPATVAPPTPGGWGHRRTEDHGVCWAALLCGTQHSL